MRVTVLGRRDHRARPSPTSCCDPRPPRDASSTPRPDPGVVRRRRDAQSRPPSSGTARRSCCGSAGSRRRCGRRSPTGSGAAAHRPARCWSATTHGDLQQVERQVALLAVHGAPVELLAGVSVRDRSLRWLGRVRGGALPEDHSVDPRAVVAALLARMTAVVRESTPRGTPVTDVTRAGDRAASCRRRSPAWCGASAARSCGCASDDPPAPTVRGWVHGEPIYLVPRAAGEVVVGATSEEHDAATGRDRRRRAPAARRGSDAAGRRWTAPSWSRRRPATGPGRPTTCRSSGRSATGVVLAAGHYRHGVLLAPLTARLVADHLETGAVDPAVDPPAGSPYDSTKERSHDHHRQRGGRRARRADHRRPARRPDGATRAARRGGRSQRRGRPARRHGRDGARRRRSSSRS